MAILKNTDYNYLSLIGFGFHSSLNLEVIPLLPYCLF